MSNLEAINSLRKAVEHKKLSLFIGAGVSIGSGLPSWQKLVLAMYYSRKSTQKLNRMRPFSNYLYAIADWMLSQTEEPLEITARKLRISFDKEEDGGEKFLYTLRQSLYSGIILDDVERAELPDPNTLISMNRTLGSVVELCEKQHNHQYLVRSVVTYNYDNLLEYCLNSREHRSIYSANDSMQDVLPIYHVHGYVPLQGDPSQPEEIVFTEDQYNLAASDPYSWSNLVQVSAMTGTVGLMIGLSLTDRNIRRLLDAVAKSPLPVEIYALLHRPSSIHIDDPDIEKIHETAIRYLGQFRSSGIKSKFEDRGNEDVLFEPDPQSRMGRSGQGMKKRSTDYKEQIRRIIEDVDDLDRDLEAKVLRELGITPIWFEDFDEIPELINDILS